MESNQRRQQLRHKPKPPKLLAASSSTRERPPVDGTTTSTMNDLPDHVLELILLRLDSSISLVRAASACRRWYYLVAGAGFLDRFRLLRVPVIGYYRNYNDRPYFLPSPTSSIPAKSMSLDFLPEIDGTWEVVDSRNGILLVQNQHLTISSYDVDPDLAVCQPLTRQYKTIRMPELLRWPRDNTSRCLGLFLSSGGRRGGHPSSMISLSNFKITIVLLSEHMAIRSRVVPAASLYRSSHGGWRSVTCGWKKGNATVLRRNDACFAFAGRANGSLYWYWTSIDGLGRALVVDEATVRVSLDVLPVSIEGWYDEASGFRVLGSECGTTLRAVRLVGDYLSFYARHRGGGEWVFQTSLWLPQNIRGSMRLSKILAAHETCLLVAPQGSTFPLSVDLRTMAVERIRAGLSNERPAYPYELPWPPTLNQRPKAPLRV